MIEVPGTQDAAYLSFRILNCLIDLLIRKGIVTHADMVTLLDELAKDLSKDTRTGTDRYARYVSDTMIPEHKIVK